MSYAEGREGVVNKAQLGSQSRRFQWLGPGSFYQSLTLPVDDRPRQAFSLSFLPSLLPPSLPFFLLIFLQGIEVTLIYRYLIFKSDCQCYMDPTASFPPSPCKRFCHLCRGPGLSGCSVRVHHSNFLREPLASYRESFCV